MGNNELIGKESFLKLIEKSIPKHFNDLNTKHTLLLEASIISKHWKEFKDKHSINTSNKDFTSLKIVINDREVFLDKGVKNFFPYPNKTYLSYGHKHNKKGLLIDLTDNVWNEIVKDGYFNLNIEFELLPKEEINKISFTQSTEIEKSIHVAFSTINMKIHVNNIEKGEHLTLSHNLSKPYGFFLMQDYEHYNQFKNDEKFENKYIKNRALFVPKSTDLDTYMWWTLHQELEFTIEPYSIYDTYQNVDKTKTFESFNFGNVLRCYENDKEHEDFYKIVGVVSADKISNDL